MFDKGKLIDTNGIRLEVFEAGEGIPLILTHGWPELAYSWRYQVPELVKAGFRVIVPNQRGYGASDKPEAVEAYDVHHLCGDLTGLLDSFGIDRAVFVGHDWGAIVVWNLALLNPERMLGLANLSVPFTPRPSSDPVAFWEKALGPDFYIVHFNRQPDVAAKEFEKNTRLFLQNLYRKNQWLERKSFGAAGRGILDAARISDNRGEPVMDDKDLDYFVNTFHKHGFVKPCNWYRNFTRNWETTIGLKQTIDLPSLMIYGAHDMVPRSDNMDKYVSDLEVHTLECGHWIQQEKPEETNRVLIDWLQRRILPAT